MQAAVYRSLGITAESASDPVLEKLEKGFNVAKVREVAARVEKHSIKALWIFLVGGPGETRQTVEETLSFAKWRVGGGGGGFFPPGVRGLPRGSPRRPRCGRGGCAAHMSLARPALYFFIVLRSYR